MLLHDQLHTRRYRDLWAMQSRMKDSLDAETHSSYLHSRVRGIHARFVRNMRGALYSSRHLFGAWDNLDWIRSADFEVSPTSQVLIASSSKLLEDSAPSDCVSGYVCSPDTMHSGYTSLFNRCERPRHTAAYIFLRYYVAV